MYDVTVNVLWLCHHWVADVVLVGGKLGLSSHNMMECSERNKHPQIMNHDQLQCEKQFIVAECFNN